MSPGGSDRANPVRGKFKVNTADLKRARPEAEDAEVPDAPKSVSAGAVDKVIDLAFNPTRDKIREVTSIDRMQGRLFPQLDMINAGRHYCLEIAQFRQNKDLYKKLYKKDAPMSPDLLDDLLFRVAQWQKSIQGKNLDRAIDIALAETETRPEEENTGGGGGGTDPWN